VSQVISDELLETGWWTRQAKLCGSIHRLVYDIFPSDVKVRTKGAPRDLDSLAAISNKLDATEEIRKLRRTRETKKKMMSPRRSNRQGGSCARRNRRRWRRSKPLLPAGPRETQTRGASCIFVFPRSRLRPRHLGLPSCNATTRVSWPASFVCSHFQNYSR